MSNNGTAEIRNPQALELRIPKAAGVLFIVCGVCQLPLGILSWEIMFSVVGYLIIGIGLLVANIKVFGCGTALAIAATLISAIVYLLGFNESSSVSYSSDFAVPLNIAAIVLNILIYGMLLYFAVSKFNMGGFSQLWLIPVFLSVACALANLALLGLVDWNELKAGVLADYSSSSAGTLSSSGMDGLSSSLWSERSSQAAAALTVFFTAFLMYGYFLCIGILESIAVYQAGKWIFFPKKSDIYRI